MWREWEMICWYGSRCPESGGREGARKTEIALGRLPEEWRQGAEMEGTGDS